MRRVLGLHQAEMRSLKGIGDAETERLERELKRAKAGDAAKVADLEGGDFQARGGGGTPRRLRRAAAEGETPVAAAVVAEMETLKKTHKNAVGELLGEIDALKRAYAKATADAGVRGRGGGARTPATKSGGRRRRRRRRRLNAYERR